MSERRFGVVAFDVQGVTALVWYFVMAHWPNPATQPLLQTDQSPMRILLEERSAVFDDLASTLRRACELGGEMEKSAQELMAVVARRAPPPDSFDAFDSSSTSLAR